MPDLVDLEVAVTAELALPSYMELMLPNGRARTIRH